MCRKKQTFYINPLKRIAANTVIKPATATERLLMAPSTSPNSIALEVPMTCDAVPMATPLAIGFFMPKIRQMTSPAMFPNSPVIIIDATVIATYPLSSSDKPMPMAVVMDFGSSVTYSMCPSLNKSDIARIVVKLVKTPDVMPMIIAVKFFFSSCTCSYNGIAKATVAGVSR